jgi:hypothetical protein
MVKRSKKGIGGPKKGRSQDNHDQLFAHEFHPQVVRFLS